MKTKEEVLAAVKAKSVGYDRGSNAMIDQRDYVRLAEWFGASDLTHLGFSGADGAVWEVKSWTEESLREQFVKDLEFAWEKARGGRGISASLMFEVVQMWMWIFEDAESIGLPYSDYGKAALLTIARKHNVELDGVKVIDDMSYVVTT